MDKKIRLRSRLLPLLTAFALLMEILNQSQVWMVLLVTLAGLWLVAFLWARSLLRGLHLLREMRYGWAQVGDKLEERFTLDNTGPFPATFVELEDLSTLPEYSASRATSVPLRGSNAWVTEGLCVRRGLYLLGGTRLHTGDPFGLYDVTLYDPACRTLTVMPPVIPLPEIIVEMGGMFGDGRPRSSALEHTISASGVRPYQVGDSARLIHWPTTARQGKPFVHLFDDAPAGDWWIVLDAEGAVQVGEGWDSTLELSVMLAASLADRGLKARRSVGLLSNSLEPLWVKPSAGENQRWEVLRALALAQPGEMPLAELLERSRAVLGRQASLIVITPSCEPAWLEPLARLIWQGSHPSVLLLDTLSFGSERDIAPLAELLAQKGIPRALIPRDLLDSPAAHPGMQGQWAWQRTGTGKAVPVRLPGPAEWKKV